MTSSRAAGWSVLVALAVLALVTLPYLYATQSGGAAFHFGGFLLNPLDGNSYLAKMYAGWQGEWRFSLPYTAEKSAGAYLFLFYIFLGHVARWTGASLPLVFHLARLLGAAALLLALGRFFRRVLPDPQQAALAFLLAALGSGLGWLAALAGDFTADLWVAEAYPFLSAYATPHFAWGLALLLYLLTPPAETTGGYADHWLAIVLAALLLALMAPFGIVVALLVLGGQALWTWLAQGGRRFPALLAGWDLHRALVIGLAGGPLLLYDVWAAQADPLLAVWNAQNVTPAPALGDVLVSLSPALLLAALGAWRALRGNQPAAVRLLVVWLGLGLVLLYVPWSLQRRFMIGLFVPTAGLAVSALAGLLLDPSAATSPPVHRQRLVFFASLLLVLTLPTNLFVLLAGLHGVQTHDPLMYLRQDEVQALDWLAANAPPDALVAAAPETGMFIPAYTGRRVVYGHPFETVNAKQEQQTVLDFFSRGDGRLLAQRTVDYVWFGPRERALGEPAQLRAWQPAYIGGEVEIYAVPDGE